MAQLTQKTPFNVEPGDVNPPSYLGASAGTSRAEAASPISPSGIKSLATPEYKADTSTGTLFSNIAKTGLAAVGALDDLIKDQIKDKEYETLSALRTKFASDIGDAVSTAEATGSATQGVVKMEELPQDAPPGLGKTVSGTLTQFKDARANKQLTEADYWLRAETFLSQMRNQYPGHKQFIDAQASSILGRQPANALWQARLNALTELAAKANAESSKKDTILQHISKDVDPAVLQAYYAGKVPFEAVQKNANFNSSVEGLKQRQKNDIALDTTSSENTQTRALGNANTIGAKIHADLITNLDYDLKQRGYDIRTMSGQTMTTEQQSALIENFRKYRTEAERQFQEAMNERISVKLPDGSVTQMTRAEALGSKVDKAWENAMYPWQKMEDAIYKKDSGALAYNANMTKNIKDQASLNIFSKSPEARYLYGIREVLGDLGFQAALTEGQKNPGDKTLLNKVIDTISTTQHYIGTDIHDRVVDKKFTNIGTQAQTIIADTSPETSPHKTSRLKALFQSNYNIVKEPSVDIKVRADTAVALFSKESFDKYYAALNAEGKRYVFNSITAPDFASAMSDIKTASPAAWDTYKSTASELFKERNVTLLGSFNEATSNPGVSVRVDQNGKLTIDPFQPPGNTPGSEDVLASSQRADKARQNWLKARMLTEQMNSALEQIKPIMSATGENSFMNTSIVLHAAGVKLGDNALYRRIGTQP